jgi:CheY-like chemotaxis protein
VQKTTCPWRGVFVASNRRVLCRYGETSAWQRRQRMNQVVLRPRIVLIEDDPVRIDWFARHVDGTGFVLAVARSGGQALGMLGKGSTEAIAALLLDHDLSDSPITDMDAQLSTSDVLPVIQRRLRRSVPVLIHSHNVSQPVRMQRALEATGFSVTRIRFAVLEHDSALFTRWLDEVRDAWDPDG